MSELLTHIFAREASIPYFYCDDHHLVTVGVGHLVDRGQGASLAQREAVARAFVQHAQFRHKTTHAPATPAQALEDWHRVRQHGATHPADAAAPYAGVASYRLDAVTIKRLLRERVNEFVEQMYNHQPRAAYLEERIQMAIVDVRFNPAGISPWSRGNRRVAEMWSLLDPTEPFHDYERAADLFEDIWGHRATSHYRERHRLRVQMFRTGATDMAALEEQQFRRTISSLAVGARA